MPFTFSVEEVEEAKYIYASLLVHFIGYNMIDNHKRNFGYALPMYTKSNTLLFARKPLRFLITTLLWISGNKRLFNVSKAF